MKIKGINHLAMVTGDMDKTVRFYRDVLGFDEVEVRFRGAILAEPGVSRPAESAGEFGLLYPAHRRGCRTRFVD